MILMMFGLSAFLLLVLLVLFFVSSALSENSKTDYKVIKDIRKIKKQINIEEE